MARTHGKVGTYNDGCHCDECRAASTAYLASRKVARFALRVEVDGRLVAAHLPPEMHGREGTYGNHGCRCTPCTGAWAEADRAHRRRRAERRWAESAPPRKDTL